MLRLKLILILLLGAFIICICNCCDKNERTPDEVIYVQMDTVDFIEYEVVIPIPTN